MSRIGKLPIPLPSGVTITPADGTVSVKGPKGTLSMAVHRHVKLTMDEKSVTVAVAHPDNQEDRAIWGLTRALLANMVHGVTEGYTKRLEINGVGFRAAASGKNLTLNLGFSHPVEFPVPEGITATVEKNIISISGLDKQLVGETAAKIRALKKPEPYKGKGIKYETEVIRRKAGKVVKAAGAK